MWRRRGAIPIAELGALGERRAAWYFRLRGYRIVGRNVRLRRGEIDLIVRRGKTLVFVEVKTRQSLRAGEGYDAVDRRKQLQLVSLVDEYLGQSRRPVDVRYDVVSLFWDGRRFHLTHFRDAFRPRSDPRYPWKWTV
jgi:Predicted endonuclease distantly related to archaeal Holliday junction resolvase